MTNRAKFKAKSDGVTAWQCRQWSDLGPLKRAVNSQFGTGGLFLGGHCLNSFKNISWRRLRSIQIVLKIFLSSTLEGHQQGIKPTHSGNSGELRLKRFGWPIIKYVGHEQTHVTQAGHPTLNYMGRSRQKDIICSELSHWELWSGAGCLCVFHIIIRITIRGGAGIDPCINDPVWWDRMFDGRESSASNPCFSSFHHRPWWLH